MPFITEVQEQAAPGFFIPIVESTHTDNDTRVFLPYSGYHSGVVPLDATKQEKARNISQTAFYSNFLYKRLLDIITDFILSANFEFVVKSDKTENADAEEVIRQFWDDSPNSISSHLREWVSETLVTGELLWLFDINPVNGRVYINTVGSDPIKKVTTRPESPRIIDTIDIDTGDDKTRTLTNIRFNAKEGKIVGDTFYFGVGQIGDMGRGIPYLTHMLDVLSELQAFIFSLLRGAMYRNSVWFDVEMAGKTSIEIEEINKRTGRTPPVPNSIIFHNERTKWSILTSGGVGAGNVNAQLDFFVDMALASAGVSRDLFEGKPDRNSTESTHAGFRSISALQNYFARCFSLIGQFVVEQAVKQGALKEENYLVECVGRPIGVRDLQRSAGAVARLLTSLSGAYSDGAVTKEQMDLLLPKLLTMIEEE